MKNNEESEEERLERLENEEFARTGSFSTSFKINIQITEGDVIDQFLKDNPDLTPKDPNNN
jgi:hypothetical protein